MSHPTVACRYFGESVEIDEDIVPLVGSVWRLEIPTLSSCQDADPDETVEVIPADDEHAAPRVKVTRTVADGAGMVELMLYDVHAQRFLDVVSAGAAELEDYVDGGEDDLGFDRLFWRIAPWEGLTFNHPGRWRYHAGVYRSAPDQRARFTVTIWFPRDDLPVVERIVRDAAEAYAE